MTYELEFDPEYEEQIREAELLASDICPTCLGSGKVYGKWNTKKRCTDCDGTGKHPDNHKEEKELPY